MAGFEIQTQQKRIINQLWSGLQKYGVISLSPKISRKAGVLPSGDKNNKDMWRIEVCRKGSLWRLIYFLEPFVKHKNKLKMVDVLKENIMQRNEIPYCKPISLTLPIFP
jgi:hypothetical protein